jgi:ubiquinone/menaquinone biosynthesis C-methylase UbiE
MVVSLAETGTVQAALPLDLLRCPETGERLVATDGGLVAASGRVYRIAPTGIPLFAEQPATEDARRQMTHYDKIAGTYEANLEYPHTQAYFSYLDDALLGAVGKAPVGVVIEVCCGTGEAFKILSGRYERGVGIDISLAMLSRAQEANAGAPVTFLQGDATRLPFADGSVDLVMTLGGIHHVNDRVALFKEIARVLKPGGRFIYREPVNDFALWRWLRVAIYHLSPMFDTETERPLTFADTTRALAEAGLVSVRWKTYGFLGFCLFMNSDVLIFNRLFRFVPGIAGITRAAARFDEWALQRPSLAAAGLQVIGVAERPR